MKQWDIGYCRLHQVNVLQGYSCSKFVLRGRTVDAIEQEADTQDVSGSQAHVQNSEEPFKGGDAL
jgi:hypothetical protein